MLDLGEVRRVASSVGCRETAEDPRHGVVSFKTRSGVCIHVYYDTGTSFAEIEHPRHGTCSVFQFKLNAAQLKNFLSTPLADGAWGYRYGTYRPLPLEGEEQALLRQYTLLEREKDMIDLEKNAIRRRAVAAGYSMLLEDASAPGVGGSGGGWMHNGAVSGSAMRSAGRAPSRGPSMQRGEQRRSISSTDSPGRVRGDQGGNLNEAIGMLLKQQSNVNQQLESLLLNNTDTPTAASSKVQTAGLTRAPSMRAADGARPAEPLKSLMKGEESDDSLDGPPKVKGLFLAQKSIINTSQPLPNTNAPFRQRGNQCCYALAKQEHHAEFGTAWSAKPANVVALGRGYVIIYDEGSVTWWDVPDLLDAKLKEAVHSQPVRYVVLGADENYYVKFMDGKMEWCAPDAFGEALKRGIQKNRLLVDKCAFGPNQGWLVLWSNGSSEHSRVPTTLAQLIEDMTPEQSIKDVSIGPSDEWFVIFKDNSVRADNLPDALYRVLSDVQEAGGRVRQVIFGENSSWYVRYWDGKQQQR